MKRTTLTFALLGCGALAALTGCAAPPTDYSPRSQYGPSMNGPMLASGDAVAAEVLASGGFGIPGDTTVVADRMRLENTNPTSRNATAVTAVSID